MTATKLAEKLGLKIITPDSENIEITKVYCCDLLSIAMGQAPAGSAWVTVMGNINSIAVATLTEMACIVIADGQQLDETALNKAKMQNVCVLASDLPIFETAKMIDEAIAM